MNKITQLHELLIEVTSHVKAIADCLEKTADLINLDKSTAKEATPEQKTVKDEKQPGKKITAKNTVTLEDVRGVLAEKSQHGLTKEVKSLIEKYGGSKLSDIYPKDYADIIKEAEVLGND